MKTSRLFHSIVIVGASLTAASGVVVAAATVLSACDNRTIGSFPIIDMGFQTIEAPDLSIPFATIDASVID